MNVPSGVPSLAHQAGSWTAGFNVSVTPGVPGETIVRFPQLAGPGGVVHVTAVHDGPVVCQAAKWMPVGPDMIVFVRCHQFGGSPLTVPFTVTYFESTGVMGGPATAAFGYVHYNSGIVTQYNSAGAGNIVAVLGVGWYKVTLPGLGSAAPAGNLQVTAVNDLAPARCKVSMWAPGAGAQQAEVRCFNAANTPQNSGFSLTYQRERNINGRWVPPKAFAYTFDHTPSNPGPYAPTPVGVNYNSQGAVNTVQSSGVGLRMITFPKVGYPIDHVQVTAFGNSPEYCNLEMPWNTFGGIATVRNVVCWNATTRLDRASFVSYTSTA
ncbi:hypothetical protein GT755_32210 [Herbidospora sp. NEAU-GS84]|uniref:Uncharacterized protein n=1 Tax=Herbidospora solisilvae TaxID=2696284 RepID=A0A7C9J796_9ACTN|nr:hypothetical protein [Herbidospora solisilvae]NAS26325.1 hypothetical protein [Herbidospora solisilvae]